MKILDWCDGRQIPIPMALASRTEQPTWARELIDLLEIQHRFAFAEIYPTSKLRHFRALQEDSGVVFERMLFFDATRLVSVYAVTAVSSSLGRRSPTLVLGR